MDERGNKRDLVLAPSEYAYMQDVTKGVIKTYTGPTVINPTAQERALRFDGDSKRFEPCSLEDAVQQVATAPEGSYLILSNPSQKRDHPQSGGVFPSPDLEVGRTINIMGPVSFALWPGEIVKLVQGHHLRSNQYLLIRIYNEDEARKNWGLAVIKPATDGSTGMAQAPADLTVGKLLIIKGTDVSFYLPPTGVAVVPDDAGEYVRDALTLERLEYCILVDQNGKKRYERGPQVVFPAPTESFIVKEEQRKFRALELNEIQGLHIKVIAPYEEAGRRYLEGDEIFLTGKETAIYFPREEHSIVRYDGRDKHFAVAVPAGEGRYVMNRKTGEIRMARGPAMLLPNPVDDVIVRRVLSEKECATWYPGNEAAAAYNRSLRQLQQTAPSGRAGAVAEGDYERSQKKGARPTPAGAPLQHEARAQMDQSAVQRDTRSAGDVLERGNQFTQPRTVVFNQKYDGVPNINLWVGYAVMVVDKKGGRRVESGPKNLLLEYDETLEVVQLSTGTPKNHDAVIETVFLRVLNNKVSDGCQVETADHVRVGLRYSLRVSFEGDPAKWFEVENYIRFLCDHIRSVLKGVAKKHSIETLYGGVVDVIRDAILGKQVEGKRAGMVFKEDGMHVTDVEVLEVDIGDPKIAGLLSQAQHEAVESNITLLRAQRGLDVTKRKEEIARLEADARAETQKRTAELEIEQANARLGVALAVIQGSVEQLTQRRIEAVARQAAFDADMDGELAREKRRALQDHELAQAAQVLRLEALRAEVESVVKRFEAAQGGFSEALLALSNQETLQKIAEAMSVQSFVGGKTLTDVVDRVFAGTPLQGVLERVHRKAVAATGNGGPPLPPAAPSAE